MIGFLPCLWKSSPGRLNLIEAVIEILKDMLEMKELELRNLLLLWLVKGGRRLAGRRSQRFLGGLLEGRVKVGVGNLNNSDI